MNTKKIIIKFPLLTYGAIAIILWLIFRVIVWHKSYPLGESTFELVSWKPMRFVLSIAYLHFLPVGRLIETLFDPVGAVTLFSTLFISLGILGAIDKILQRAKLAKKISWILVIFISLVMLFPSAVLWSFAITYDLCDMDFVKTENWSAVFTILYLVCLALSSGFFLLKTGILRKPAGQIKNVF